MRPPGEIRQAVLQAAGDMVTWVDGVRRGPTLREIAHRSKVSEPAARIAVQNLTRGAHRKLERIYERKVDYRNKPVAEYAPVAVHSGDDLAPLDEVGRALALWIQR